VERDDDGLLGGERREHAQHVDGRARVESTRRLIEHEQRRCVQQREREGAALALAPRDASAFAGGICLADARVDDVREAQAREQSEEPRVILLVVP